MTTEVKENAQNEKKKELRLFLFLTIFFAPIVTFSLIAGYGFIVWMLQILMGPPGV